MKIKILDLEKKIPYKIKRNTSVIGIDSAQTTGIIFLKTDKTDIHIDYLVLSFKTKNYKEIYNTYVKTFEKLIDETIDFATIEQVFVGFSRAGSLELARYSTFVIAECIKKNVDYELISAVSARSRFKIDTRKEGKGKSKIAVGKWINGTLGVEFTSNDLNDALILALCGICEDVEFKNTKKVKKRK